MSIEARRRIDQQIDQPPTELSKEKTMGKEMEELSGQTSTTDKGKTPILEHFHTPGSIGNVLAWGDQKYQSQ
jgi:hypothetical protein